MNEDSLRRNERITLAVTATERATVEAAAAIAGLSASAFGRHRLLQHGSSATQPVAPALAALLRTLAQIEGRPTDPALVDELRRALAEFRPILLASLT